MAIGPSVRSLGVECLIDQRRPYMPGCTQRLEMVDSSALKLLLLLYVLSHLLALLYILHSNATFSISLVHVCTNEIEKVYKIRLHPETAQQH